MADSVTRVFCLIFDGISTVMVQSEDLDDSWAVTNGFVSAYPCLTKIKGIEMETNIRTSTLPSKTARFRLEEVSGTILSELFSGKFDDADALLATLDPGDTPAPAAVRQKHVGTEYINGNGDRHRYSCIPGYILGMQHIGQEMATYMQQSWTPVSDGPILWAGRRCALYAIARDEDGVYEAPSASNRVWWGTLLDQGKVQAGVWEVRAEGVGSWIQKNLGQSTFQQPIRCIPALKFLEGEDEVKVSFVVNTSGNLYGTPSKIYGTNGWQAEFNGATSVGDVIEAFNQAIDDAQADSGTDGDFDTECSDGNFTADAGLSNNQGFYVKFRNGISGVANGILKMRIHAHEKAFLAAGYDVNIQTSDRQVDKYYAHFRKHTSRPGYYTGTFYSARNVFWEWEQGQDGEDDVQLDPQVDFDNGGGPRYWLPMYPGGGAAFFMTSNPQEVIIQSYDRVFVQPQLTFPPAELDGDTTTPYELANYTSGDVNAYRKFLFFGPYREEGSDDIVEKFQVGLCSWRSGSDYSMAPDDDANPRLVVRWWDNPHAYGFENDLIVGSWAVRINAVEDDDSLFCIPLSEIAYNSGAGKFGLLLQRILLTTGTELDGWYTDNTYTNNIYGWGGGVLKRGDNDSGGSVPKDADIADMGLGIPSEMVQGPDHFAEINEFVENIDDNFVRQRIYFVEPQQAETVLRGMLEPLGLCWSLAGGKYGVFSPWKPVTGGVDVTITPETLALSEGQAEDPKNAIPKQEFRAYAPIDKLEMEYRINAFDASFQDTWITRSNDPGARYRAETITRKIKAPWLSWKLPSQNPGMGWTTEAWYHWQAGMKFWASRHFVVKQLPVHFDTDIWPGSTVRFTNPWVVAPDGTYGVTNMTGYCLKVGLDPDTEVKKVDLLIHDNSEDGIVMYGPCASCYAYDANDDGMGHRLLCHDDYLEMRNGNSFDVEGFGEPDWSEFGGQADIEILQYGANFDGWVGGAYATVSSVNADTDDCYLVLTGAPTGTTIYRDTEKRVILRDGANQGAAWVLALYGPITDDDGTYDGGGSTGVKLI